MTKHTHSVLATIAFTVLYLALGILQLLVGLVLMVALRRHRREMGGPTVAAEASRKIDA